MFQKKSLVPAGLFLALLSGLILTTGALGHTVWLETSSSKLAADKPLNIIVGFNEGFEVVDIIEQGLPNIGAPTILGADGEITTKLATGGKNYDYVTDKPLKAGSYLGFAEYKPFIMGHGDSPKNKYFMTNKYVFNVGATVSDDLVTKPQAKSALEIVPLANPASLKAGGSLKVQVLFEGKPLARATVLGDFRGFNPAGSWGLAKAFYCNTDKKGEIDFLPVKDGLWILKVRHAVPNTDKTEAAETVYISSLTFFVGS
ncbi:MAG: DUF4198 domain-containing protein [Deltaproteobacteria bacterium]|jgi:uncharacterized GH25 family protein|nr:DUF4198 domain-containing protein [Deltaproteobacteria bacterium]